MRTIAIIVALALTAACTGDAGPMGPQGPTGPQGLTGAVGPQGPEGPGYRTLVTTLAVTEGVMYQPYQETNGAEPGLVCFIAHHGTSPNTWLTWDTDTYDMTACALMGSGSYWRGAASFPDSFVNSGWTVRFVLFWAEG
jgi:hypothetical protein